MRCAVNAMKESERRRRLGRHRATAEQRGGEINYFIFYLLPAELIISYAGNNYFFYMYINYFRVVIYIHFCFIGFQRSHNSAAAHRVNGE